MRRCFCGWSSVSSPQRAKLSAVLTLHQEVEDRLLATDEELQYINNRIGPPPPQVDNDAEYHRRCIALAEAAEEEVATMESVQCGGCNRLCSQLEPFAAALRSFVASGSLLRALWDFDAFCTAFFRLGVSCPFSTLWIPKQLLTILAVLGALHHTLRTFLVLTCSASTL